MVKFDPKSLKGDLLKLAAGSIARRLGGPRVQAAMALDEVVGGITGERLTERVKRGFKKGKSEELKRRMKERIIPLGLEF